MPAYLYLLVILNFFLIMFLHNYFSSIYIIFVLIINLLSYCILILLIKWILNKALHKRQAQKMGSLNVRVFVNVKMELRKY